jgi:hypothetical protein
MITSAESSAARRWRAIGARNHRPRGRHEHGISNEAAIFAAQMARGPAPARTRSTLPSLGPTIQITCADRGD